MQIPRGPRLPSEESGQLEAASLQSFSFAYLPISPEESKESESSARPHSTVPLYYVSTHCLVKQFVFDELRQVMLTAALLLGQVPVPVPSINHAEKNLPLSPFYG